MPRASTESTASMTVLKPDASTAASSIGGEPFDRIAVRKPNGLEPSQNLWDLRKGFKRQVKIHQPIAQAGLFDRQRLQREVERIAGDLPEIRVPALHGPQPGILQLLVTPERAQLLDGVAQDVAAASRRRGKIEQRAGGIEDTSLHAGERCVTHRTSS